MRDIFPSLYLVDVEPFLDSSLEGWGLISITTSARREKISKSDHVYEDRAKLWILYY